ncbi:MAG: hypothetical protein C0415_06395 [Thermodesulfovibrio sp.]|nr:hypothetical protein [Thermodesulfovibrio sp.]
MKIIFLLILLLAFSLISCAPVTISKCAEDYKYSGDKVISVYKECVAQTPERIPPLHLKHKELYE